MSVHHTLRLDEAELACVLAGLRALHRATDWERIERLRSTHPDLRTEDDEDALAEADTLRSLMEDFGLGGDGQGDA